MKENLEEVIHTLGYGGIQEEWQESSAPNMTKLACLGHAMFASLANIPEERAGPWLVGIGRVKTRNAVGGIGHIAGGLPRALADVIVLPMHEVEKLVALTAGVQDLFHFILDVAVYLHKRRGRQNAARN